MFVVKMQDLENYGAHAEDGKFSSGNAYWKFKGGTDYLVIGLDRIQDAVAFVAATQSCNSIDWKSFPTEYMEYDEWIESIEDLDHDYRSHLIKNLVHLDVNDVMEEAHFQ